MRLGTGVTENGHNNSSGNGKFPLWVQKATAETLGLGIAEMASAVVSVGVFALADDIAPSLMKKSGKVIGRLLEPFLDPIERAMQGGCKLKECQPDFTKSRQERAEEYGRFLTRFGVSLVPAVLTEYGVRKIGNHYLHVGNGDMGKSLAYKLMHPNRHDCGVIGIDKGVQLGGIIAVNTIFAKQADVGIEGISNVLQKTLNWPKERADRAAQATIVWHLADGLGFGAAGAKIWHEQYSKRNL